MAEKVSKKNRKKKLTALFVSLLLGQLCGWIYCSQTMASYFGYNAKLGYDLGGLGLPKVYLPFAWLLWYFDCKDIPELAFVFNEKCFEALFYFFLGSFMVAMFIMMRYNKTERDEHGTAHFADDDDMYTLGHNTDTRSMSKKLQDMAKGVSDESVTANDNDLFHGDGVFLGQLDDGRYLRDSAKTHILLLAPTRSGKGVSHIVPTLLTWRGSVVVADPKGENWQLTAGYRKYIMGNKVLQFKPMHEDSCRYNPFSEIRITTAKEMGDLQLITKILVDPTGEGFSGGDTHWIESADILLQGVTLHLLYQKRFHNEDQNGNKLPGAIATLSDVLDFLYDGQDGKSRSIENRISQAHKVAHTPREFEKVTVECEAVEEGAPKTTKEVEVLSVSSELANEVSNPGGFVSFDEYSGDDDFFDTVGVSAVIEETAVDEQLGEIKDKLEKHREEVLFSDSPVNAGEAGRIPQDSVKSEFEDDKKEGVEGLQKKLQWIITSAQYIEEDDILTGFKHAPDDDPELFEHLYPDKVSRRGMHPFVRQIFQSMIDKPDKEFGSILSTLDTALAIYRNPILVANISSSDFVMKDIMDCDSPISLYLVFGPGEIDVVKPLLRVIVELMWRLNVEELFAHKQRLLMLLDEFPAFGKLDGIERSAGFTAGYGIKLFIVAQDMNQINKLYTADNYIVSNCQVQIYHGPSDNNSAKYISDKLGTMTREVTSETRKSNLLPFAESYNDSLISRPLMTPDEVYRMPQDKLIVFCKGCAPIYANKIKYYIDPHFKDRVKIKPPGHSDAVAMYERDWNWHEYRLLEVPDKRKRSMVSDMLRTLQTLKERRIEEEEYRKFKFEFENLLIAECGDDLEKLEELMNKYGN